MNDWSAGRAESSKSPGILDYFIFTSETVSQPPDLESHKTWMRGLTQMAVLWCAETIDWVVAARSVPHHAISCNPESPPQVAAPRLEWNPDIAPGRSLPIGKPVRVAPAKHEDYSMQGLYDSWSVEFRIFFKFKIFSLPNDCLHVQVAKWPEHCLW